LEEKGNQFQGEERGGRSEGNVRIHM
jgi:hypothetical protein